jgi:hypothetical protein
VPQRAEVSAPAVAAAGACLAVAHVAAAASAACTLVVAGSL